MSLLPAVMSELWRRGEAWGVLLDAGRPGFPGALKGGQRGWLERFHAHNDDAVNGSGRQRGKSFGAYAIADTLLRKWPGSKARYCALTIDTANAILLGGMGNPDLDFSDGYLATCPSNLRPYRDGYDWVYPGGGRLIVFGTDAQTFRRGRGSSRVSLDIRDEFGFYQDLDGVEAALNAGLTVPGPNGLPGRTLRISTPALSNAHPSKLLVDAAKAVGRYELETLYDNPRVEPEAIIRKECQRLGLSRVELLASTWFRREYLGEWVTEESRAAVPSWTPEVEAECVREWPRPKHFDGYTAHDWGGQTGDPHAALFGFYDFAAGKFVVEDEDEVRGVDTGVLAARWKAKEEALWGSRKWDGTLFGAGYFEEHTKGLPEFLKPAVSKLVQSQPFIRVCDTDEQLQKDMLVQHGYALLPTAKHDKHLAVDSLVIFVRQRRLIIHPRCKRTIAQLRSTLWNSKRTEWERTPLDHGDLIDDLVYIVRNIFWHRDPAPPAPVDPWGRAKAETGLEDLARAMTGRRR